MACGVHGDVGEIARVRAARVLGAVLGLLRIEVSASRVEVRRITSPQFVDVNGFAARRDTLEIEQKRTPSSSCRSTALPHHAAVTPIFVTIGERVCLFSRP